MAVLAVTAIHKKDRFLPIRVLPVPGGPNNNRPLGGPLNPVKISLQLIL